MAECPPVGLAFRAPHGGVSPPSRPSPHRNGGKGRQKQATGGRHGRQGGMRRRSRSDSGSSQEPGAARVKLLLARAMRGAPTQGEARLWAALRGRRLEGWRFRRQQVIAGYVVDFYCAALWLAVEVDGSVHIGREEQDAQRDEVLSALGVRVHRVRNDDVIDRLPLVRNELALRCASIAHDLQLSAAPSPHSDGGKAGLGGSCEVMGPPSRAPSRQRRTRRRERRQRPPGG